ncbi:MAG: TRAP transporter substrate-binding protein [Cellvibrionaceae bacterium]
MNNEPIITHSPKLIAAVFILLALLVLVFGLFVVERSKNFDEKNRQNNVANQSSDNKNDSDFGAQQQYEWTMVTSWPKNLPGLGSAAANVARFITEASGGRIKVKVYGADEIVPALGVFDAVSSGSVQMGHTSAYYWKGKIPAAQFFTSVPFGLNAQEMNGWLFYGGGLELWRDIYAPYNLVPFAGGNTGVQMAGWFNKEINSVEDLKGLKMRIPGMGGEVFNRAGGTAVTIAGGELYTAMQTGTIDATEWVGPYNDVAFGLHQVAKYYYYPGWHEPGPTLELIVNKEAYDALPNDLQHIIELATRSVNQDMLDEYTTRNNNALQQIKNDKNIEIRKLPDDVLEKLEQVANEIYEENATTDPLFKKVYTAYRAYQKQVNEYHEISEQAYYELRK